jgi:hypothetical protein
MLRVEGGQFKDESGRIRLLRGVNLGGSSKVPFTPDGATWRKEGFFDHRNVSFVGRPFPLGEADEHFSRLKAWGLTFLRLLVPWEAVEHGGPGLYDTAYLDYLRSLVEKAGEYGMEVFIDPHQDVWSRFSGGDGAPGWTFEAVGMNIRHFDASGAAITHQGHGDPFPRMIWPTNDAKLAAATMFTLFFAGNDFAPQLMVEGEPVQEYLQRYYLAAMQQVAQCLHGLSCVVGYDTLNEPASGYIGNPDLDLPAGDLHLGHAPTPFQSMLLGEGIPQQVAVYSLHPWGMRKDGKRLIDPQSKRAWLEGKSCIWKQHGVWELAPNGEARLLRPDYFSQVGEHRVDFNRDYLRPFANRYAAAIREIDPKALIFVESIPHSALPEWGAEDAGNIVAEVHWYDAMVLMFKDYHAWLGFDIRKRRPVLTPWAIRCSFEQQISRMQAEARQKMGGAPLLVGEFGIPFDLQEKRAFRDGDFSQQVRAMERSLRAMDDTLTSWTLWNYTADNSNQRGDQWNDEDLSIFCRDQQTNPVDIHSGGRALQSVVRPFPTHIAGKPLRLSFDIDTRHFQFYFHHDPQVNAPTEIFVPQFQYPHGCRVEVSDGEWGMDGEAQLLVYRHSLEREEHWIKIRPGT